MNDDELLKYFYDELIMTLITMSLPADEQQYLVGAGCIGDEILEDFDDFYCMRRQLYIEKEGLEAYCKYQIEHEDETLKPGAGFPLVQAILKINEKIPNKRITEVIIMSRNNADRSLRIFNSIDKYGLDIKRAALTSGVSIPPYLKAFNVDLFLSAFEDDVQQAIDANIPAVMINSQQHDYRIDIDEIRIAFDGDTVLFSDESEKIYQEKGLDAFIEHEKANAKKPLTEGPMIMMFIAVQHPIMYRQLRYCINGQDRRKAAIIHVHCWFLVILIQNLSRCVRQNGVSYEKKYCYFYHFHIAFKLHRLCRSIRKTGGECG